MQQLLLVLLFYPNQCFTLRTLKSELCTANTFARSSQLC